MKKLLCSALIAFTLAACTEESEKKQITYEVLSAAPRWYGEYIDETGNKVCNCTAPLLPTSWKYTFEVKPPFTAHIDATFDGFLQGQDSIPGMTTNIYVNEALVISNTNNWTKGIASADYEVK